MVPLLLLIKLILLNIELKIDIVRENATVDELLKKMEGMEVGTDGSLTHQGTAVTKAKLMAKHI